LRPVIFIGILDFEQTGNKNYISRSQVRDIETGEQTLKDMEFTFIELPKFKLEMHELETLTEKWVYFIKNAENLDVIPENIHDKGLKSAYEEANVLTWTQDELDAYEYAFMREEDERARLDKAEQKGILKGIQEGIQKGIQDGKVEVILEMYNDGFPVEKIARLAKMTAQEVSQIIEKQLKSRL
jgi:predicted transposase/invertase (TIGR01784 family)